jgi:hypothetical protein
MKTYIVTLAYTSYAHYEIEAESEDAAQAQAWARVNDDAMRYGEWEVIDTEERATVGQPQEPEKKPDREEYCLGDERYYANE